jgi:hypothetical protein
MKSHPSESTLILVIDQASGCVRGCAIVSTDSIEGCVAWIRANVEYAPADASLDILIAEKILGRFVNPISQTVAVWVRRPS